MENLLETIHSKRIIDLIEKEIKEIIIKYGYNTSENRTKIKNDIEFFLDNNIEKLNDNK